MDPNLILAIFTTINIPLAIWVYKNNPKSWTNRLFALLIIFLTSYLVINSQVYVLPTYELRLFFARFIMANAAIINLLVFLFLSVFPDREVKVKPWLVYVLTSITSALFVIAFTPAIFVSIQIGAQNVVTPEAGPLMPLFGLHTIGLVFAGLLSILLKFKRLKGLDRSRILYVFFAFFVLFTLILVFNFIFPVVFKNGTFVPLLPIYIAIFLSIVSYAIIRHRLLEFRTLVARSVMYTLLVLLVAVLYVLFLFGVGNLLFPGAFNQTSISISALMALLVAFSFPSLRSGVASLTDRVFFRHTYNANEVLHELTRIMASTIELQELTNRLSRTIVRAIKIQKVSFIIPFDDKTNMIGGSAADLEYSDIKYILDKKNPIILEDAKDERVVSILHKTDYSLIIPLFTKDSGKLGILLLGQKNSGEIYNHEDLNLMTVFGQQVSVAIENTLAYRKIQQFSEELKEKVDEATERLQQANDKLKDIDKRKDEFISVAAHDLRAPLTAVKGYLSMIMEGDAGKLPKKAEEFIQGALEGTEREIRLVNNMLNVSRIEENRLVFEMGTINLAGVVKEGFNEFITVAKDKLLEYSLEIEKGIQDSVHVDRDRIHEVVANLISNSIKYTDVGSVTVRLSNHRAGYILFSITDTGRGMADDERDKLFTKFYRAQSSAGTTLGTGLGLYITKLLVEKFGGTIGIESEFGKGSNFWFELPIKK